MQSNRVLLSILGWVIGFVIFFPILWMVMASLKTEIEAVATPPSFFFVPLWRIILLYRVEVTT